MVRTTAKDCPKVGMRERNRARTVAVGVSTKVLEVDMARTLNLGTARLVLRYVSTGTDSH